MVDLSENIVRGHESVTYGSAEFYSNIMSESDWSSCIGRKIANKHNHLFSDRANDMVFFAFDEFFFGLTQDHEFNYRDENGDIGALNALLLRVCYVSPDHRNKGLQSSLLGYLRSLADQCNEIVVAFTTPFELVENKGTVLKDLNTFVTTEYVEVKNDSVKEKQRQRYRDNGFINWHWPHGRLTTIADQWAYIPDGLEKQVFGQGYHKR